MTEDEYKAKLQEIESESRIKKRKLYSEFVLSSNNVKVGDIVKDHIGSVVVEKIKFGFSYSSQIPEAIYYGTELRKDSKQRKDKSKRQVYQSNLI